MPNMPALVAFLAAATLLAVIPGPSVLFVVGRSVTHGRRAGLTSVFGADLGLLSLAVFVAFGVGALITASQLAYWVIKIGGVVYLFYLGIQAIRHRKRDTEASADAPRGLGRLFGQAFIVGVTNPKSLAILTAVLPQFVDPAAGAAWSQLLVFGSVFTILALVTDSAWALTAGTARAWFARSPKRRESLAATGGAMMIALGGFVLLERRTA